MGVILYAVRNLKSCLHQVENIHLSRASEQDIMDKTKHLLIHDPKLKKGFKFDHVWVLMKDILKFTDDIHISIPETLTAGSDTIGSPTSQSSELSSFSINLNSEDGGSNSSQRPIGSKKAKLNRKIAEGNNSSTDSMVSSNEEILNFLKESTSTKSKNYELQQLRLQN